MQRAYRDDMQCPHCGSNLLRKAGLSHGKQTYRRGECLHPRRAITLRQSSAKR